MPKNISDKVANLPNFQSHSFVLGYKWRDRLISLYFVQMLKSINSKRKIFLFNYIFHLFIYLFLIKDVFIFCDNISDNCLSMLI